MRLILESASNNKKSAAIGIHKVCSIACPACIFARTVANIHYNSIFISRVLYCIKYKYFIYARKFVRSNIHKVTLFTSSLQYKVLI